MTEAILKTQALTKRFGSFSAVNHLDIEVKKGDIYGLVGKNGAGKTTLLKMICGLSAPTSGNLELMAQTSESGLGQARAKTGCIIETPGFLPYLSAEKNLEYYRIQRGYSDKSCVKEALKFVGLSKTGNKKFKNFSLGMKQRLGLALAILDDPEFLILDEPINGLDPMGMAEFREIILKLNREKQTTILISSHILGELSQIATTYGFIDQGKLIEHISAAELEEKCKVSLQIKVDDTAKASKILTEKMNCSKIKILNEHEMTLEEYLDAPELVVQTLVKNDIMLSQIKLSGLNLEEHFIGLIGGKHNA